MMISKIVQLILWEQEAAFTPPTEPLCRQNFPLYILYIELCVILFDCWPALHLF